MGWAYLVLDLLFRREGTGLVCHFAGGNTEPEGGGRRPCVGCTTPHVLSVSLQLPSLQAEPTATAPSVAPQGQSSPGQVLAHLASLGSLTEQSHVLGEQPWGWTLGHSGFQVSSSTSPF